MKSKKNLESYLEKIQTQIYESVAIPQELLKKQIHHKDIEDAFEEMHKQEKTKIVSKSK